MRFLKSLYFGLLLSASFGLFCDQLPDCLSLSEDTSNDYVADSVAPVSGETQQVRKDPEPALPVTVTRKPTPLFVVCRTAEPTLVSGRDLLQLVSIQRK